VNEYEKPFVKPTTVQNVPRVAVHTKPPGLDVTVNTVIAEPPLLTGAVHDTND
jgi:hypothetical protein